MDITVQELKAKIDAGETPVMIDVREPHEWNMQHLPGVQKISLGALPGMLAELETYKSDEVVMICRSGNRSGKATAYLRSQGFADPRNLAGGMLAWKQYIDPTFHVQ